MCDDVLNAVERVHDEVDACRDADWSILGERLRKTILDSDEHAGANLSDAKRKQL